MDRKGCAPDGPAEQEVVLMDDDDSGNSRKREEQRSRIRTVLAGIKLVLWILWVLFDPRHPY